MKIKMLFMRGIVVLAELKGETRKNDVHGTSQFSSEDFMKSLLEAEKAVNLHTNVRLHIFTEPEQHDAKD